MSHFSILIGAVVLLSLAAPFIVRLAQRRKHTHARNQPVNPAPVLPAHPFVTREIFMDSDGFSLLGDNWKWTGNLPASYCCSSCGETVDVTLRQYYHAPSGYTFSLHRHKCVSVMDTRPLATVQKKGDADV